MKKLSGNMLLIILFLSILTSFSLGTACNNLTNPFQSLLILYYSWYSHGSDYQMSFRMQYNVVR